METAPAFGLVGRGKAASRLMARAESLGRPPVLGSSDAPEALVAALVHPRTVVVEAPAGAAVDEALERLYVHLEPGDILVDASASYWGDTLRRYRRMRHRSLYYVDIVVAGDARGLELLVGGEDRGVVRLERSLGPLARGGRLTRAGEAGAAHFARLVEEGLAAARRALEDEVRALLDRYPAAGPGESPPGSRERLAWLLDDLQALGAASPVLAAALMKAAGPAQAKDGRVDGRVGGFLEPGEEKA